MRAKIFVVGVVLMTIWVVEPASAGLGWRPLQTVDLVRGVPQPDVAVAEDGRAALVYSSTDHRGKPRLDLWVRRFGMPGPFVSGAASSPGGATDARVVMSPSGVTAVVALETGRIFVTMYPSAPIEERYRGKVVEIDAHGPADDPQIGIDAGGRATVVWTTPPRANVYGFDRPRQVYATTVGPGAVAGPVEALGDPGNCDPALDVNLRGDAVIAVSCPDRDGVVFHRPAGGGFGAGERPFAAGIEGTPGAIQVGIDGQGVVHALQSYAVPVYSGKLPDYENHLVYAVRPSGGSFSSPEAVGSPSGELGSVDLEVQENGRVIAGWQAGARFVYAVRAASGSFGAAATAGSAHAAAGDRDAAYGGDVVTSPHGPVLLVWRDGVTYAATRVAAAILGADGKLTHVFKGIPGEFPAIAWAPAFAINDSGQVAGTWEQQCSVPYGALAVMAVQRDVGGRPRTPPCQDMRAPKVAVRPRRARLAGGELRARIGCDEACRLGVRARVLRGGRGKPLATAKSRGGRRIAAARYRTFRLRLTKAQARKVRTAQARGRRVSVRLALSVRDDYDNGAVRRVAVPLRR